jgi:phosphatidyl-myo-inositol alpha-mannosyltransferase
MAKIALVSPYDLNVKGGVNTNIILTARELLKRKHKVGIFAPHSGKPSASLEGIVNGMGSRGMLQVNNGGSVSNLCIGSWVWPYRALQLKSRDVVHFHEISVPFFNPIYLLLQQFILGGTPRYIATFHASGEDDKKRKFYSEALRFTGLKRIAANMLDERIAVSHVVREYNELRFSSSWNRNRVQEYRIIPNPVDTELFTPDGTREELSEKLNLLFVGRHGENEKRKGFVYLAQALQKLSQGPYRDKVHLYIAGPGELDKASRDVLSSIPSDLYTILGELPFDELRAFYRSVDAAVVPPISNESFGYVVAEGMASGTPIIASAIDGLVNVASGDAGLSREEALHRFTVMGDGDGLWQSKGGLLVEPQRPELLALAIELLADNPAMRRMLGVQGRQLMQDKFSVPRVVDQLEQLYFPELYLP